jgi:polysaccharide biosynthesis protein PslJ
VTAYRYPTATSGLEMEIPRQRKIDAVSLLSLYVLFLMAVPAGQVFGPLGGAGAPATIFSALLLVIYLAMWAHPGFPIDHQRQPIRVAAVLFVCVILAAYVSANRLSLPGLELNGADRGLILAAGWLAVLLIAADGIDSADRLRTLLRRVVLGATAMAAVGVTQFATGFDLAKYILIPGLVENSIVTDQFSRGGLDRPAATAAHPLEFAAVLGMCLPLAIHQARFAPPALCRRRWLQVALIGAALPLTVSRSAFLALAVAAAVMIPTWPRRDRRQAYVVILVASVGIWLMVPGLLGTVRDLFLAAGNGTDASAVSRTSAFDSALPFIAQHPWLGRGFGTFLPQTYFFTDDQFLNSTVEIGIVGLLALLGLFVTGWLAARNTRRLATDPSDRDLAQSLAASTATAVVAFATFDALSFTIAAGLTFLLLGCTGAAWRLMRRSEPSIMTDDTEPMKALLFGASATR